MSKWHAPRDIKSRQETESRFHDKKYGHGDGYPRHYALRPTYPIYRKMRSMIGARSGQRILEYGCGEGWITRDLVESGATVNAFDISVEAVNKTRAVLAAAGVADVGVIETMGAEQLGYPDETFDIAVGFAILHHLDLEKAIPELYRVLKVGGVGYFAEPMGGNPMINLYRWLTPQYRTPDEVPLDLRTLAPLLNGFREVAHTDYYVLALASVALAYLPFGKLLYPSVNRVLMALDEALLRTFPGLGHLAWYTILKLEK
jgi:SAM-dependent methyltransferase